VTPSFGSAPYPLLTRPHTPSFIPHNTLQYPNRWLVKGEGVKARSLRRGEGGSLGLASRGGDVELAAPVHQHHVDGHHDDGQDTATSPHPLLIRARHTIASHLMTHCSTRTWMAGEGGGVKARSPRKGRGAVLAPELRGGDVELAAPVHQHDRQDAATSPHPLLIRTRHTIASHLMTHCSTRTWMAGEGGGVKARSPRKGRGAVLALSREGVMCSWQQRFINMKKC
jgi:hypothetical protein